MVAVDAVYSPRTRQIKTAAVDLEFDGHGFLCDKHRRAPWYDVPADPRERVRRPADKERDILRALRDHAEGLTAIELQNVTGHERTAIYKRLAVMARRDQVKKEKNKFFIKNYVPNLTEICC